MTHTFDDIRSEYDELSQILSTIPVEDAIERLTFENRLAAVKKILDSTLIAEQAKKIKLTFKGGTVKGTHGIEAGFGSTAATFFSEIFATVVASLNDTLQNKGPIPGKSNNQLLITGTAIGSFGFEFELPNDKSAEDMQSQLFESQDVVEVAMKKIQSLIELSSIGDDDEITEIADNIHPRAIKKFHEFLNYLVINDSYCSIAFDNKVSKYASIEDVKKAAARLSDENIKESTVELKGQFDGMLPHKRTFEFIDSDNGNVIFGKIDSTAGNISEKMNTFLKKDVKQAFHVVQVGNGSPRYRIQEFGTIEI